MKARLTALLSLGVLGASWGVAHGQQPGPITSFKTDYHRNNLWPTPFRSQDTLAVQAYIDAQRNSGWRLYNTLGTQMFDADQQCLTSAGRAHIHWILNNAPPSRRVIFVLKGPTPQATAQRIEATQLAISELLPVGDLPAIYLTDVEPASSSGVYQTAVHRAMMTSTPAPRLPAAVTAP
jgi:hypothetical protein